MQPLYHGDSFGRHPKPVWSEVKTGGSAGRVVREGMELLSLRTGVPLPALATGMDGEWSIPFRLQTLAKERKKRRYVKLGR